MSTHHKGENANQLAEAARAALHRQGEKLLDQLESMRQEGTGRVDIEPLDPQAELALRQHGDDLLADLASQRAAHSLAARPPRRRRWLAIAAILMGIAASALLLNGAFTPKPPPAQTAGAPTQAEPEFPLQPLSSPAIPEPSSTLLALAGALVLIVQRRR